ncbi:MAG TPA: hypothetical protein PKN95_08895 [Verrucomicrobiota bacterium]|nr:hypothetical protein [Verrucomicrobiota bacterium]HNT15715.1 hypothetical protein [Verrucomicrobiota bacterium]
MTDAHLPRLREALLRLHKTLVESERVSYEQTMGRISTPNHFLHLLTTDPWFAWLHPLSLLIVSLDQVLEARRRPLHPAEVEAVRQQTERLLVAAEHGHGFAGHYFDALQRDPDVILAHAAVVGLLKSGQ